MCLLIIISYAPLAFGHEASFNLIGKMKQAAQCHSLEKFPKLFNNSQDPFDLKPSTMIFNVLDSGYSDAVFWCHWQGDKKSLIFWQKHSEKNHCPKLINSKLLLLGELSRAKQGFVIQTQAQKQHWQCINNKWQLAIKIN